MTKEHLALRKKIKAKKPTFISQDSWKRKRIRQRWQKPKGFQSKIRLGKKGYRKLVTTGYGSPKSVSGLHISGLEIKKINSESDLKNINKETQGIIISGSVGMKKKSALLKKAQEAEIKVLNIKDVNLFLTKAEEKLAKRKETKAKRQEKKKAAEKKKQEKVKKEESKSELSEKLSGAQTTKESDLSPEEKKDVDKKEKDKLLTKQEK